MLRAALQSLFPILALSQVYLTQSVATECADVVQDCGAKPDDHTDNTQAFTACLHLASKRSGCVTVPPGPYRLTTVVVNVSNIEIRVSNDAVLRPWAGNGGLILETYFSGALFEFGNPQPVTGEYVQNVSLHGEAPGVFTVDVSGSPLNVSKWKAHAVSLTGGIKGFVIANMHCWMANPVRNPHAGSLSTMACVTSNYRNFSGLRLNPQDGIVQNISCKDCTFGYGLVQLRSGERVNFQNMYSEGGITLRLETGDGIGGYAGDITAQNITCKDGHEAFMAGPHIQKNGAFHVKDVTSLGCYNTVSTGAGYSQYGYPNGYFSNSSTITNVLGVYGAHAQNSSKNVDVPSCSVCGGSNFAPEKHVPEWNATITNIRSVGFPEPSNRAVCVYNDKHSHRGCPFGSYAT